MGVFPFLEAVMELWIPITVAAALFQTVRTALQKRHRDALGTDGVTFARFGFGLPVAAVWLAVVAPVPVPGWAFLGWAAVGGLAQILATLLLVEVLAGRGFAVGTAWSKTETVQTALIGVVVLGEVPGWPVMVAVVLAFAGVMAISAGRGGRWWAALGDRAAGLGLAAGAGFAVASVCYRGAALALDAPAVPAAALTLVAVTAFQTGVMVVWLGWRRPVAVVRAWRAAAPVGVTGALGSIGWFTAMAMENAAAVRAVGQVELVFTLLASRWLFAERLRVGELAGIAAITAGVLVLILAPK